MFANCKISPLDSSVYVGITHCLPGIQCFYFLSSLFTVLLFIFGLIKFPEGRRPGRDSSIRQLLSALGSRLTDITGRHFPNKPGLYLHRTEGPETGEIGDDLRMRQD